MLDNKRSNETARPEFVRMATWCSISGLGPTRSYELLKQGKIRAVRVGGATLIDLNYGLNFLANSPAWEPSSPVAPRISKTPAGADICTKADTPAARPRRRASSAQRSGP